MLVAKSLQCFAVIGLGEAQLPNIWKRPNVRRLQQNKRNDVLLEKKRKKHEDSTLLETVIGLLLLFTISFNATH